MARRAENPKSKGTLQILALKFKGERVRASKRLTAQKPHLATSKPINMITVRLAELKKKTVKLFFGMVKPCMQTM